MTFVYKQMDFDCLHSTLRTIRNSDWYKQIPRGSKHNGRTKSRNSKRELCARNQEMPPYACHDETLKTLRKSRVYRGVPRGTVVVDDKTKSRSKKNDLCDYLQNRRLENYRLMTTETDVTWVKRLGRDDQTGEAIWSVVMNYDLISDTDAHDQIMSTELYKSCGEFEDYAFNVYLKSSGDVPKYLSLIVMTPEPDMASREDCTVLASTLVYDREEDGVEIDIFCAERPTVQSTRLLSTVNGDNARRVSAASLLACFTIHWIIKYIPETPKIYLYSVADAISKYGTWGFLPVVPTVRTKALADEFGYKTFGKKGIGNRRRGRRVPTDLSKRNAQQNAEDTWNPEEGPDGLYYMEMDNKRAKTVIRERCNGNLHLGLEEEDEEEE